MKVAYLVNQYPKVSHTFIRREILALERQGVEVLRYALRGWDGPLVDPADDAERARTRYVLKAGPVWLVAAVLLAAMRFPARFASALAASGRAETAALLLGAFDSLGDRVGGRRAGVGDLNTATLARIRAEIDEETFAAAWEQGRALTLEHAVVLALECSD